MTAKLYQPYRDKWVPIKHGFDGLSPRELEVTQDLCNGANCREIARKLNICYQSVSTYKARIYAKLNVENEAQLIHLAFARGRISNMYSNEPNG